MRRAAVSAVDGELKLCARVVEEAIEALFSREPQEPESNVGGAHNKWRETHARWRQNRMSAFMFIFDDSGRLEWWSTCLEVDPDLIRSATESRMRSNDHDLLRCL